MKEEKRNAELRLADFNIKTGDILLLEEWDPKKKEYTGKLLRKRVKKVTKLDLLDFYTPKSHQKIRLLFNRILRITENGSLPN